FYPDRLVPADELGERVAAKEFTGGNFGGGLLVSIGCHLNYNVIEAYSHQLTRVRSFSEILLARGVSVIGNTGYGYADDVILANSEKLMTYFMHELRYSQDQSFVAYQGGTPIGKALLYAKQKYLSGLTSLRGIDEKVMEEATVFGLPMTGVTLPTRIPREGAPAAIVTAPFGAVTGLSSALLSQTFSLQQHTDATTGASFYYANNDLSNTAAVALRPIVPAVTIPAGATVGLGGPSTLIRGVVLKDATYTVVPSFRPRIALPSTQDAAPVSSTYRNTGFTPLGIGTLNTFGATPSLILTPFQYLSSATGTSGTARRYDTAAFQVYASDLVGPAALAEAPLVYDVQLSSTGTVLHVELTVGIPRTTTVADVWLTYTGSAAPLLGQWRSVAASQLGAPVLHGPSGCTTCGSVARYAADIDGGAAGAGAVQLMVQAVGGNALVTRATNSGRLYSIGTIAPSEPERTKLAITGPVAGTSFRYFSRIPVSARLVDSTGAPIALATVKFKLGSASASAVTNATGDASALLTATVVPTTGPREVTAGYAGDATRAGSTDSTTVVVTPARTALRPGTVQYGDSGVIAKLVLPDRGDYALTDMAVVIDAGPVAGKAVAFTRAGSVRLELGDLASLPNVGDVLTLTFTDPTGRYDTSSTTVTVAREDATLGCSCKPQPAGAVTAGVLVTQAVDGSAGDLRTSSVTFTNDLGVVVATVALKADGTLPPVTLPSGLYTLGLVGSFAAPERPFLAVFDPTRRVAGLGVVRTVASTTGFPYSIGLPVDKDAAFAFAAGYLPGGTTPTGASATLLVQQSLLVISLSMRLDSIDWLVITGKRAVLEGAATVNGVKGMRFRIIAVDNGTVGDTYEIRIWDPRDPTTSLAKPKYAIGNVVRPIPVDGDPVGGIVLR
ncbi:MAG: Ig-like domain-containing protein, partial [Chloroflexota bacterium]|nr:Ig-like domain-containing protein [Chloroflexota bacterium]